MDNFTCTALIPAHQKSLVGTWTDGVENRFGQVEVVLNLQANGFEHMREQVCRLLIPLGVTICAAEMRRAPLSDDQKALLKLLAAKTHINRRSNQSFDMGELLDTLVQRQLVDSFVSNREVDYECISYHLTPEGKAITGRL